MKNRSRFSTILILGFLSAIGPFSIDMYLPGFPDIATNLHSTVAHVTLSLSSFFIGISAGQLLYGPLLDRFGRKRPLFIGLIAYLLASLGCAFAWSVNALVLLRLLQALGGCVGMVASRAMVRDIFHVNENARIFSLLMLVVGVSPLIAPTLGGYIAATIGWRFIFVALTVMAAGVLIAVHFGLKETKLPDPGFSLKPTPILKNFVSVLKEPQFYTYVLTGSSATAGLYAYIAGSPYVFMELFKVTEKQYGWIFALVAMGLIGSSQLNSVLLRTYKSEQIIRIALVFQSITGIILFVLTIAGLLELFSTIFLIFIFLCCQGFIFPNSSALTLAPFTKNAGSASALMGSFQMAIGAFSSAMVSVLSNHSALPMTGIMALCAITAFCLLHIGKRMIRFRATEAAVEEQNTELISTS